MAEQKNSVQIFPILVLIGILLYTGYLFLWPKINTSWVVDTALSEVKGEVYENYGELPTSMSGEILYKNRPDYIVVVKYDVGDFTYGGSTACHVYGYRKGNAVVSGMTSEYDRNFDYDAICEELKALWRME